MRLCIGKVAQDSQLTLNLCWHGGHFVTQTEIEGHIRAPAPVVLEIRADDGLTEASLGDGAPELPH